MIAIDEDALICDLAETYQIYNYRSLPCRLVATFSCGLRENARIKLKINKMKVDTDTLLLALAVDRLSMLTYFKTKDAEKGINKPTLIAPSFMDTEDSKEIKGFDSAEDFENERLKIIGRS